MPSSKPHDALYGFVELLRTAVSCITEVPLVAQAADLNSVRINFSGARPIPLRAEQGFPDLKLSITHHCQVEVLPAAIPLYAVTSTYYAYDILDLDEAELLVYHWHPTGQSAMVTPHLHLSSKIGAIPAASLGQQPYEVRLADIHIPTGRVTIQDIVSLLITEFSVIPIRADWVTVLDRSASALDSDAV